MKFPEYLKLKSIMESLMNSTDLRISNKLFEYTLGGLNSFYLSHKKIDVDNVNPTRNEDIIVIANMRYALVITTPNLTFSTLNYASQKPFPKGFLGKFLYEIQKRSEISLPEWIFGDVNIVWPNPFVGFEKDGNPKYSDAPSIVENDENVINLDEFIIQYEEN